MPHHLTCSRTIKECVEILRKGEPLSVVTEKRRKKISLIHVPQITTLKFTTDAREGRILYVDNLTVETEFKHQTLRCVTTLIEHTDRVCFRVYLQNGCSGQPMSNLSSAVKSYCEAAKQTFTGSENGKSIFGITKLPVQTILRSFYAEQLASEGLLEAIVLPSLEHIGVVTKPWKDRANNVAPILKTIKSTNSPRKRLECEQSDNDSDESAFFQMAELTYINLILSGSIDAFLDNDLNEMELYKDPAADAFPKHDLKETELCKDPGAVSKYARLDSRESRKQRERTAELTKMNASNDVSALSLFLDGLLDDELSTLFDGLNEPVSL